MNKEISSHIAEKRKNIRRVQVNDFFSAKRELMTTLPKDQAVQTLKPHLSMIRRFAQKEEEVGEFKQSLQRVHLIIKDYDISSFLVKRVEFQSCQLILNKFGPSFNEMTWMDLFLFLLKQFRDDSVISEECSFILLMCTVNLRRTCSSQQGQSLYSKQLKRLSENYPYQLLMEPKLQIIGHSLSFVYEVIHGCQDGSSIYFLVNKAKPNILALLNSLAENECIIEVSSVQEVFLNSVLTVIYFIGRYNYVKYQEGQYLALVQKITNILMSSLINCKTQQQFLKYCEFMRVLSYLTGFKLKGDDFSILQKMLEHELNSNHTQYILMLKSLLYNFTFVLQSPNIKLLMKRLFALEPASGVSEEEEMKLKYHIVDILSSQIVNNGNRFPEEDIEIFISCWGEYTQVDRLLGLVNLLDYSEFGEKALKTLFELLMKVMMADNNYLDMVVNFLEDELESLLNYPQFQEVLRQHNFSIEPNP